MANATKSKFNININDSVAFDAQEWFALSEEEQKAYLAMRQKNNQALDELIKQEISDADQEILNLALRANAEGILHPVTIVLNPDRGTRRILMSKHSLALINQAIYGIFVANNRANDFRALTKCNVSERLMPDKFALIVRVAKAHPEMFLVREKDEDKKVAKII